MLKISLCDDDNIQLNNLHRLLNEWGGGKSLTLDVYEYNSAENFLFDYEEKPCDLLLLDIEMGEINGMELAKKLRDGGDMLPIIFITGYSDYIGEGYDVQALHYLLKPVDKEKLFSVLDRYADKRTVKNNIVVNLGSGITHVCTDDIVYVESFGKKTEIHLANKSVLTVCMSIAEFESIKDFIRTHRSYIVNLRFVKSVGKSSVTLDNGGEIPVSRRLRAQVTRRFIDCYKREDQ